MDDGFVVREPGLEEAVRVLEKGAIAHRGLQCESRLAELLCSLGREDVVKGEGRTKLVEVRVYMRRVNCSPLNVRRVHVVGFIPADVLTPVDASGSRWRFGRAVRRMRIGVRRTLRLGSRQDDAVG